MNEVNISLLEIQEFDPNWSIEAQFRMLLKSKGVPLKGHFWPDFDPNYIYQRAEDHAKNCIVIKWKKANHQSGL